MENTSLNGTNLKKERNYGIDALRTVAMLMVVTLHVLGFGGVLTHTKDLTFGAELLWSIKILCYSAVNIYAIISGFVGYRSSHKGRNLIYLCLQLFFFSAILTGIDTAVLLSQGAQISASAIFHNLFPSIKMHWYFSAYFCLFFFMPILDKIIDSVPQKALKICALLCFAVFCCISPFSDQVTSLRGGYSVFWLILMYTLGAYISKYDPLKKRSSLFCFLGFAVCSVLTVAIRIIIVLVNQNLVSEPKSFELLVSYVSPTVTLAAVFIVCAFAKLNIKGKSSKKIIAFLCPLSFGVYLLHCHPIVAEKLQDTFAWVGTKNPFIALLLTLGISLAIFSACMLIDWLRLLLFKAMKIKKFSEILENLIKKPIYRLLKIQD